MPVHTRTAFPLALAASLAASTACAQPEITVSLIPGTPTLVSDAACPPGDPGRMFVVTRAGVVRILNLTTGQFVPGNVTSVPADSSSANGVTGIAFHPGFASNGYFYLWLGTSITRLRMIGNPLTSTIADTANRVNILRVVPNLSFQHVGGWIGFGPDGMLWVSTGDSGGSANGQRTDTLAAKILRLDVNGPDGLPGTADDDAFPADDNKNYCIPADNPFVGVAGEDEIWAYGLRNPYRCSFDSVTGDFWIGDVGSGAREEIDFQPAHQLGLLPGAPGYVGGRNYGWGFWEGTRCASSGCNNIAQTPPIAEYPHNIPLLPPLNIATGTVIIGGLAYHGCKLPQLRGWYIFGDAGSVGGSPDFIWAIQPRNGVAVAARQLIQTSPVTVYGFVEDAAHELYVCSASGLCRVNPADTTGRDRNNNGLLDSCEPGCGADFNADGDLNPDDLGDFITAYFSSPPPPAADWNHDNTIDPDDLGDYITTYFGCTG